MNILPFLNSRAIAEHWEKIGYAPAAEEAAFLIHKSRNRTLREKQEAYREIIETMPDVSLPERLHYPAVPSLHAFLWDYMNEEDRLLERFMDPNGGVYQFEAYSASIYGGVDQSMIYPSFSGCVKKLRDCGRYESLVSADVTRQTFGSENPLTKDCITVRLNAQMEITSVDTYDSEDRFSEWNDFFDNRWFAFPTPFCRGDIVYSENVGHTHVGCDVFVLQELSCWGSKELQSNGIPDEKSYAKGLTYYQWRDRRLEDLRKDGDAIDMTAAATFRNPDGTLYDEVMHDYLDLDFYREKPKGADRILIPVSNFFKGKINETELITATHILQTELYLDQIKQVSYTEEGLKLMGVKE